MRHKGRTVKMKRTALLLLFCIITAVISGCSQGADRELISAYNAAYEKTASLSQTRVSSSLISGLSLAEGGYTFTVSTVSDISRSAADGGKLSASMTINSLGIDTVAYYYYAGGNGYIKIADSGKAVCTALPYDDFEDMIAQNSMSPLALDENTVKKITATTQPDGTTVYTVQLDTVKGKTELLYVFRKTTEEMTDGISDGVIKLDSATVTATVGSDGTFTAYSVSFSMTLPFQGQNITESVTAEITYLDGAELSEPEGLDLYEKVERADFGLYA